jgi:hypothetical protein
MTYTNFREYTDLEDLLADMRADTFNEWEISGLRHRAERHGRGMVVGRDAADCWD